MFIITAQIPGASPSPDQIKELKSVTYEAGGIEYGIGQLVPGHGIYVGLWHPHVFMSKRHNVSLLHAFAAPEDLQYQGEDRWGNKDPALFSFDDAVREVAKRRNWHGHDGVYVWNDDIFYNKKTLEEKVMGKWFIPRADLLMSDFWGHNDNAQRGQGCLFSLKNVGDFKGTVYCTVDNDYETNHERGSTPLPEWYRSCSILRGAYTNYTWAIRPRDGAISPTSPEHWVYNFDNNLLRVRPFRVEPVRDDTLWELRERGVLTWYPA